MLRNDDIGAYVDGRITQLEAEIAAQIVAESPKGGSAESLTDYALQMSYLRGQLDACRALRTVLFTPTTNEE